MTSDGVKIGASTLQHDGWFAWQSGSCGLASDYASNADTGALEQAVI